MTEGVLSQYKRQRWNFCEEYTA